MLVLTPKYGSQNDLVLLNNKKKEKQQTEIHHRRYIDLNECQTINEAFKRYTKMRNDEAYTPYVVKDVNAFKKFLKYHGSKKTSIDVSWVDVSNLTEFAQIFSGCKTLEYIIGLNKWDVSNSRSFFYMFEGCDNLRSIDGISEWNMDSCISLYGMFARCKSLKKIRFIRVDKYESG